MSVLDSFNPNDPYRRFIERAKTPVFFDYSRNPVTGIVTPDQQQPQSEIAPPPPRFLNPQIASLDASSGGVGIGSGVSGQGAGSGGIGVGPSSISGVGPGSAISNIGQGTMSGTIAALMGLAGAIAPGPVGIATMAPSIANALGLQGLTQGIAVSNDQSSNNAAADAAAIAEAANAMGIGPDSAGPVGPDAAASSPANAAAADAVSADTGASPDAGDSGSTYSHGGRAFARFKGGGRPRGAIKEPVRNEYPELWDDPREIARNAATRTAPEDPSLMQLWGIDRGGMYERFKDREGSVGGETIIGIPAQSRGAQSAWNIMTPKNAQRMQDTLVEGRRYAPDLMRGMHIWYPMDPVYERLTQLTDKPDQAYTRFNSFTGMSSPQSAVPHEIARGTAANSLDNMGRFEDFVQFVRVPAKKRASFEGFPSDMTDVPGSLGHKTHVDAMRKFIDSGRIVTPEIKVPLYVGASDMPHMGNQTNWAVPDAHFTRGVDMTSTRTAVNPDDIHGSMSPAEGRTFMPWFRENVASPVGIEAVPAQAQLWGLLSGITGVKSPVGAPKLELLSRHIMRRANRLGIDPELMRDKIILGEGFAKGGRARGDADFDEKRHPVPRSMKHLYRQFARRELTPTY